MHMNKLAATQTTTTNKATETLDSTQLKLIDVPQFSKNAPLYISIGGGLSSMVGLPKIATWNTLGRPAKPKRGTTGLNIETKRLEIWNGSLWYHVPLIKV